MGLKFKVPNNEPVNVVSEPAKDRLGTNDVENSKGQKERQEEDGHSNGIEKRRKEIKSRSH